MPDWSKRPRNLGEGRCGPRKLFVLRGPELPLTELDLSCKLKFEFGPLSGEPPGPP